MTISWTDPVLSTSIKARATHLNQIVTYLNTERTKRSLSTITLTVTANTTLISLTHIMTVRTACNTTPLTIGCSSYNSTVNSAKYISYGSCYSCYYSTANSGQYYPKYTSVLSLYYSSYCPSYTKGPCFIGERILWLGLTQL